MTRRTARRVWNFMTTYPWEAKLDDIADTMLNFRQRWRCRCCREYGNLPKNCAGYADLRDHDGLRI